MCLISNRKQGIPPSSSGFFSPTRKMNLKHCFSFRCWPHVPSVSEPPLPPSAEEVQAAERALRGQLQADGVPAEDGYVCARYNEPTTPPFLRLGPAARGRRRPQGNKNGFRSRSQELFSPRSISVPRIGVVVLSRWPIRSLHFGERIHISGSIPPFGF